MAIKYIVCLWKHHVNINGVKRLSIYVYNIDVYFRSALIGCY